MVVADFEVRRELIVQHVSRPLNDRRFDTTEAQLDLRVGVVLDQEVTLGVFHVDLLLQGEDFGFGNIRGPIGFDAEQRLRDHIIQRANILNLSVEKSFDKLQAVNLHEQSEVALNDGLANDVQMFVFNIFVNIVDVRIKGA